MSIRSQALVAAMVVFLGSGAASAVTREIASLQPVQLTFDQSVLNQVSFETYRTPFDELQTRPFNLLFANIGRHSNLSPWQGQEGSYTRYLNALIGNNGRSDVDNGVDAIQGSFNLRSSARTAWGLSAAVLAGNDGSDDTSGISTFTDADDLSGVDLRGAVSRKLTEASVLGLGIRLNQASAEDSEGEFETGVGGFTTREAFDQTIVTLDAGIRTFTSMTRSWDVRGLVGVGRSEVDEYTDDIDDTGMITDRFVTTNYDIDFLNVAVSGGYNWLKLDKLGETEVRGTLQRSQHELANTDLAYDETGGAQMPLITLVGQDPIATTGLSITGKTVFPAGETEVFAGGELGYTMIEGGTQVDLGGQVVTEEISDSLANLGLTLGLRQALLGGRLRVIVSGHADILNGDTETAFDAGIDGDSSTQTLTQYAIAIEGVLANVVFDLAWLSGEEVTVFPVELGIPAGSRRIVQFDRLVVSAAVSW